MGEVLTASRGDESYPRRRVTADDEDRSRARTVPGGVGCGDFDGIAIFGLATEPLEKRDRQQLDRRKCVEISGHRLRRQLGSVQHVAEVPGWDVDATLSRDSPKLQVFDCDVVVAGDAQNDLRVFDDGRQELTVCGVRDLRRDDVDDWRLFVFTEGDDDVTTGRFVARGVDGHRAHRHRLLIHDPGNGLVHESHRRGGVGTDEAPIDVEVDSLDSDVVGRIGAKLDRGARHVLAASDRMGHRNRGRLVGGDEDTDFVGSPDHPEQIGDADLETKRGADSVFGDGEGERVRGSRRCEGVVLFAAWIRKRKAIDRLAVQQKLGLGARVERVIGKLDVDRQLLPHADVRAVDRAEDRRGRRPIS